MKCAGRDIFLFIVDCGDKSTVFKTREVLFNKLLGIFLSFCHNDSLFYDRKIVCGLGVGVDGVYRTVTLVREGDTPSDWAENKARQKDVDARWTRKNNVNHYGYKNHISIDAKHKFIRKFEITPASTHDSQVFESLFDLHNSSREIYADSAYRSDEHDTLLKKEGYRNKIQRRAYRGRPLKKNEIKGNKTRSKVRSRVEHVFGVQAMMAKDRIIRGVGLTAIQTKVTLRNIGYNMMRFSTLANPNA